MWLLKLHIAISILCWLTIMIMRILFKERYKRYKRTGKAKNGVTISELEEELGFPRGSIYKWNKHLPNVKKLKSVSQKLGKPMEYFLVEKG